MKKEYLSKKTTANKNLLKLKTAMNISLVTQKLKEQQQIETQKNPDLIYFTGDEGPTLEVTDLLENYDINRWKKKFTSQKNKIDKHKLSIFFKKYVYNRIAIPYLSPYKLDILKKLKSRIKENEIPLTYDYHMISGLIKNQKCLLVMRFRDIEVFIDSYEYFIKYFEIKQYYSIMRYLLTFVYSKAPLSFTKNFYYNKHNDKLENDFDNTISEIYKLKLYDSDKKIIKKMYNYFFIKDVPIKKVPNIIPNYFINDNSIKNVFEKYVIKEKYSKIGEKKEKILIKKNNSILNEEDYILKDYSLSGDYSLYNNKYDNITKKENPFLESSNKKQNDEGDIFEIEELINQIDKAIKAKNENQNNIIKTEIKNKCLTNESNTEKNLFNKKKKIFKGSFDKQILIKNTFHLNNKNNCSNQSLIPPLYPQANQSKKLFLLQKDNISTINKNQNIFTKNSFFTINNQFSSLNTLSSSRKNLKDGSDFIRDAIKKKKKKELFLKNIIEKILSSNNFFPSNDTIVQNQTNKKLRAISKIKKSEKNASINKKRLYSYRSLPKKEMAKVIKKSNIHHPNYRNGLSLEGLICSKKIKTDKIKW